MTSRIKDTVKTMLKMEMPDTHDSVNDARKALEGLNLGGGRNGGRRGIPENVDIDQIRELFNRR